MSWTSSSRRPWIQDGVIQLSARLASRKGMEEIAKAAESGEVVEGDVTGVQQRGGVVVNIQGVKVFVPFSGHCARDEDHCSGRPAFSWSSRRVTPGRKIVGASTKVSRAEQG